MKYFDPTFERWSSSLSKQGILHHSHWLLKCPDYLLDCCPNVRRLEHDFVTQSQLSNMTPAAEFWYVLIRRLCEMATQIISHWLLPVCLITIAVTLLKLPRPLMKRSFNSRRCLILASSVLASVVFPSLLEIVFGNIIEFELNSLKEETKASSFKFLFKIHEVLITNETPSFFDLLQVSGLWRNMYADDYTSISPPLQPKNIVCFQTKLALMVWSILGFLILEIMAIAFIFEIFVVLPLSKCAKSLYRDCFGYRRKTAKLVRRGSPSPYEKEKCSKVVLEPGDKRSASTLSFSTNLEIDRTSDYGDGLIEQLGNLIHPEPGFLFQSKDDSNGDKSPKKQGKGPLEPGFGSRGARGKPRYPTKTFKKFYPTNTPENTLLLRKTAGGKTSPGCSPRRYASTGTYACFDSEGSSEEDS